MYHGLSAFSKVTMTSELNARLVALAKVSACYANKPIGRIGVYVNPDNAKISDGFVRDCYSYTQGSNGRHSDNWQRDSFQPSKGESMTHFVGDVIEAAEYFGGTKYCEFWACLPDGPDAIWYRDGDRLAYVQAKYLSRKSGLPIFGIKED